MIDVGKKHQHRRVGTPTRAEIEGNGSKGFATTKGIVNALSLNFSDLLIDKSKGFANKPRELFRVIYNPKIMFDFLKFKTLFACEIIPSQMALYENYVIFNPAQIVIFGNP